MTFRRHHEKLGRDFVDTPSDLDSRTGDQCQDPLHPLELIQSHISGADIQSRDRHSRRQERPALGL